MQDYCVHWTSLHVHVYQREMEVIVNFVAKLGQSRKDCVRVHVYGPNECNGAWIIVVVKDKHRKKI